jgi:hypothetical protein
MTGVRSTRARTRGQNPLVLNKLLPLIITVYNLQDIGPLGVQRLSNNNFNLKVWYLVLTPDSGKDYFR